MLRGCGVSVYSLQRLLGKHCNKLCKHTGVYRSMHGMLDPTVKGSFPSHVHCQHTDWQVVQLPQFCRLSTHRLARGVTGQSM
jgi:hypothetical protein